MNWDYYRDASIERANVVAIDTRDFYLAVDDTKWTSKYDDSKLLETDDLLKFIEHLETITGGKGEWRIIQIKEGFKDHTGWDLKYVHFYKVDDCDNKETKKQKWLLISPSTHLQIDPSIFTKDNIDPITLEWKH